MLKNIFMVAIALMLPLHGFANDLHLKLPETAYSVLAPKANGISLKEVEDAVVNDQLDIQISYERLLQAQRKIGQARSQYFPYGLGTLGVIYLLNSWNPILLIELVTSLPSKVYNVQSEKNMKMATLYSNEALAANIKNQIGTLYYTILKEESALKLSRMQLQLMETLYGVTKEKVAVGLATQDELHDLEIRLLDLKDITLRFAGYLSAEKSAFNLLVSQTPVEGSKVQLQPVGKFLESADYNLDSETLKLQAVDRSPEIVAADYMITAASRANTSAAWSILSFSGIGFGYWGRVQVAGSKTEQARVNRELVETTLINQTYVLNNTFQRTLDHFNGVKSVFNDSALFYDGEFARFNASEVALDRLLEIELIYVKDFSTMVAAHYESLIKLNNLERAVLGSAKGTVAELEKIEVVTTELNNGKVSLSIKSVEDVLNVQYVFDNTGWYPTTITNAATGYAVVLKTSAENVLTGHVNVTLKSGKIITKKFKL
jgi:hypothetical protein